MVLEISAQGFIENPSVVLGCVLVILFLVYVLGKVMTWIDKKMMSAIENSTQAMNNVAIAVQGFTMEMKNSNTAMHDLHTVVNTLLAQQLKDKKNNANS
ncbi:MAG: hypothetical protein KA802_17670 [Saprospiraceae bacterium]|nr:hypothetical protein [Saprospiraceae bacterium]